MDTEAHITMKGIVYIHVPKCGGSSFGAALRLRYLFSQATISLAQSDAAVVALYPRAVGEDRIVADYDQRRNDLARLMARRVRCISGHVRYDEELHARARDDYAFITLLRNPVDRFVSHYRYLQRRHPDPKRPNTIEGFLETTDAARIASQYLFYFAGQSQSRTENLARAINTAQSALARFDLIGDLGDPVGFARNLRALTGGPLPLWHRNRAPAPTAISPALRIQIAALCAADIDIYHSAQNRMAA